jgi:hypothetical protein
MKNLITFWGLFFTLITPVLAQNRFSIAPTLGFIFGHDEYQLQRLSNDFMHHSATNKGLSVGVTGRYYVSPKLDVSIGLALNVLTVNAQQQYNQPYKTMGVKMNTGYAQVPVLVNYRLLSKRLSPYVSVGASFSNYNHIAIREAINTSALIGIGVDYRLGSKLSLLVQPTGSYLLKQPPNDLYNTFSPYYSYLLGLQTQLIWRF